MLFFYRRRHNNICKEEGYPALLINYIDANRRT